MRGLSFAITGLQLSFLFFCFYRGACGMATGVYNINSTTTTSYVTTSYEIMVIIVRFLG